MRFLYQQYLKGPSPTVPGGIIYRPVIPLRIIGAVGSLTLSAFVDTPADETIVPRSAATQAGAKIDAKQTWHTEGLGGHKLPVALGELDLELTDSAETLVDHRWFGEIT